MSLTAFSGAIIRAGRAIFGTVRADGAFVTLATRTVVPVFADDVFTSRGNVTNAMVRKGSALLTASSVSVRTLPLRATTFYEGPFAFIDFATVGNDVTEAEKTALKDAVATFYGIDR